MTIFALECPLCYMAQKSEFIIERDNALYKAYRDALRSEKVHSHQQAIRVALNSPTSRFWIPSFQAYREILKVKKTGEIKSPRGIREKLIKDLYDKYLILKEKPMFRGYSTYFITCFVVSEAAPRFYISYSRALSIISRMRKQKQRRRKEDGQDNYF